MLGLAPVVAVLLLIVPFTGTARLAGLSFGVPRILAPDRQRLLLCLTLLRVLIFVNLLWVWLLPVVAWAILGHVHLFVCIALVIVSASRILLMISCMVLWDSLVASLALVTLFQVGFSVLSPLLLVGGGGIVFL